MREGNCLRKLARPETIILVLLPTAILTLLGSFGMLDTRLFGFNFWTSLVYLRFFGWQLFYLITFIAFAYLTFSVVASAIERRRFRRPPAGELSPTAGRPTGRSCERLQAAGSLAGLAIMYAYAFISQLIAMNALCQPSRQRVAWADDLLMRADHVIFGTYVPFETHEQTMFQTLAYPMLFCYLKLSWVVALVLIALCVFQYDRFRQYALAFLMVMFFALVGWFTVPALTPSEAYRLNKLHVDLPLDIALETAAPIVHLNPYVAGFLNHIEPWESVPAQGRFCITSFPSLHVAWGMLAVWFGVMLWRRSALLLVPWGVLNALGAVFSLQHYAVDVLAGMLTTYLAVVLVRHLIAIEVRSGLKPPKGYAIFESIRKDVAYLGHSVASGRWSVASE